MKTQLKLVNEDTRRKRTRIDKPYVDNPAVEAGRLYGRKDI